MTFKNKETLQQRQQEMRLRIIKDKQQAKMLLPPIDPQIPPSPFYRPLCTSCKKRAAREGSTLCSRCTFSKQEASLRDVLPGVVVTKPAIPVGLTAPHESEERPYKAYLDGVEEISSDSSIKQYTRKQVSKIIGVAVNTIGRWEKKGKTPSPQRIAHSGQIVYDQALVDHLKEYVSRMENIIHPVVDPAVKAARAVQTKTYKPNKRLERAVSSRISLGGGRSII